MKWWDRIVAFFNRGYEEEDLELEWDSASIEEWDWDALTKDRSVMKIQEEGERRKFVRGCIEQISNASSKLDEVADEYNMVTAYLKDIEEIESLPSGEKDAICENAKKVQIIEGARKEYKAKKNRLTDGQFFLMEQYEEIMPKPYEDIKKAEEYRDLVKGDLSRLEGEKHAYYYRKSELYHDIANAKGMIMICCMAMAVCTLMLLVLQFGFDMDTSIGYILTIGAGAAMITLLYIKYLDYMNQLKRTEQGINKIVLLKNTVNIRYVNNTNLLDYLYMKYKVNSGKELLTMWERYQQEKHERSMDARNKEELDHHKRVLISVLRRYQLHDPEIWIHQTEALLDKKEMVEIRHNLVEQRQKLRAQIDYNKRLIKEAQNEISRVTEEYPQYKEEILDYAKEIEENLQRKKR